MWKQLFSEAPAGAFENLLSPRRKALYAFFALAPGTTLGLYLFSVKRRMDSENERLRLEHVGEELQVEHAREEKDAVLLGMIQDMRERIRVLEAQTVAKREADALTAAKSNESEATAVPRSAAKPTEDAASLWEQQKIALRSAIKSSDATEGEKKEHKTVASSSRPSGINERVRMRQQELLKKDIKAFKAARDTAES